MEEVKSSTLTIMNILVTIKEDLAAIKEDTQDVKSELVTAREHTDLTLKDIRTDLATLNQDTNSTLSVLQVELTGLKNGTQYIKTDVEKLRKNMKNVKKDLASLREDTQDVKRELETVREDTQDVKRELVTVKEDTQDVKRELATVKGDTNSTLQDLKMDLKELNHDTNSTLMDLQVKLTDLKEDTQCIKTDVESLRQNTDSALQDLKMDLKELNHDTNSTLMDLQVELTDLKEDTQCIKTDVESLRQNTDSALQNLKTDLATLNHDTNSTLMDLHVELTGLKEDTQCIKTDVESLRQNTDSTLQDLKMDLVKLNQDTNSTLMDLATLREDTNSRMQDLQEGLATLRQEGSQERAEVNATVSKIQETVAEDNLIMNSVRDASQKHQQFTTEQFSNISEEIQDIQQSFLGLASQCNTSSPVTECDPLISVQYLPTSCSELAASSPSGYYWVRSSDGSAVNVYCDMARHCCGSTGGWMRVAYLNMTDTSQQCPEGFRLRSEPKRTCELIDVCTSIFYPSRDIQYSKVCGRVRAYQYGAPLAFWRYYRGYDTTIDSSYVSGMSITHGESPRKHIWTFAAAVDERFSHTPQMCPCTKTDIPFTGRVPPFIGNDYFCDTGSHEGWEHHRFYPEDPLWDGEGCGPTNSCCQFNSPPWFCKELPQPTTDDVEVRVCKHDSYRDTPFDLIELYVQ